MTSPHWWTSFPERPDLDDDREPDEPEEDNDEPEEEDFPDDDEREYHELIGHKP